MKFVLTAIVMIVSVMAMADIPRPAVDPILPKNVDAEAINALVYGLTDAKLKDLKSGGNSMTVQRQNLKSRIVKFTFTTRQCMNRGAAYLCMGGKQVTVTKTESDRGSVTYKASEILRLR